jgi:hypothetical protein
MSRSTDLHQSIVDAVTDDDVQAIIRRLIDQARHGDKTAARLILGYLETPTEQEKSDEFDATCRNLGIDPTTLKI